MGGIIINLVTTIFAVKMATDFIATANTQPIITNIEGFVALRLILPDADFCAKALIQPIWVATEPFTSADGAVRVIEVIVSLPKIWNLLQLRYFPLHQIPINLRFSLRPVSSTNRFIQTALQ